MKILPIPSRAEWRRWLPSPAVLIAWGVLLVALLFTYWSTLTHLEHEWRTNDTYSHGYVVPLFAAFLLWLRQGMVNPWPKHGTWWAVAFLAGWALLRWANFYLQYERDADTLFPLLMGIALCLGGWRALHWSWPAILFLEFMVPLPARVSELAALPLQTLATRVTAYVLQTLGVPAIRIGNVIQLSDPSSKLDVERACSGLNMLTLFVAISVGAVFVIEAKWWEKAVIVASSIPIAIIANVLRITLKGAFQEWISVAAGNWVHDYAGWIMMPLAMLMLWGEMTLISRLIVEVPSKGPLSLGEGAGALARGDLSPPRPSRPRTR